MVDGNYNFSFICLVHCFSTPVLHLLGLAHSYQSSFSSKANQGTERVKEAGEAWAWRQASSQAFGTGTRLEESVWRNALNAGY